MVEGIVDEKNLSLEELEKLFLKRRKLFQLAKSPEDICELYEKTLAQFPIRYKFSTQDYAEQNVPDVILRNEWFLKNVLEGLVVDIGCSDGYFALSLANSKRKIIGIDMLKKRVNRANQVAISLKKNAEFVLGFSEKIPYPDNYFDSSILSHMLEHVYNPEISLKEAVRVTKNKGRLIAIVPPNIGRDPTHIRWIPSKDLKQMLSKYGNVSEEFKVGIKGIGYILTIVKL
ncbi:MAG: class I SAM-dependent methyltransferase [Nanoarchaeota archaeon]|nr:class I SAM-dependent methyltransferase [Nanoarchaeota archaeon]